MSTNVATELAKRELRGRECGASAARLLGHASWVARLGVAYALPPHAGCVNTVNWSPDGSLLLTGSDDLCIAVVCAASRRVRCCLDTGHSHNVFDARFVPGDLDKARVQSPSPSTYVGLASRPPPLKLPTLRRRW